MSSDWVQTSVGQFCPFKYGKGLPERDRKNGHAPVISSAGVVGWHDVPYVMTPGIVIGRKGTVGSVTFSAQPFWPIDTAFYVEDVPQVRDIRYTYYMLKTLGLETMNSDSAVPGLNRDNAQAIAIRVPELEEQRNISCFLTSLDDRITLLRETNATLEAIAQALFKSWFVDFDPVRAKSEGRAPEGMNEATAALFPDSFEESALGLVPKGWQLVPFGQLLVHTIGGDWGSEAPDDKNDTQVAIIRGTDIPDLQTGASSRVPVRYTSKKKLDSRRLTDGDLILEVSGGSKDQPTGRALYVTDSLLNRFVCPVEPASFCRLLRPTTSDVGILLAQHLIYIYAQGKTWEYQNQSTGIANFQTTHFLETELVAVPDTAVMSTFFGIVRPMVDRAHLTQAQELSTLRDTLLPRLISGQLRLPEAQEQMEDTAA